MNSGSLFSFSYSSKDYLSLIGLAGTLVGFGYAFYLRSKLTKAEKYSSLKPKSSAIELIGYTPIVKLQSLSKLTGCDIYVKLENQNPGRSVKDRAAKHIIFDAISKGDLSLDGNLYESTSGSTGISLGLMCNILGISSHIYLNDDLAEEKYRILELIGCKLNKVESRNIVDNGNFVKVGLNAAKNDPKGYFSNQFNNPSNYIGHYTDTGPEIYEQMEGKLDYFVAGAGTGATLAGVSLYLKEKDPRIKTILADPQGSCLHSRVKYGTLFSTQDKEGFKEKAPNRTFVEGIGLMWLSDNFEQAIVDDSFVVTDQEAYQVAMYVLRHDGMFIGSSSAINIGAALKIAKKFGKGKTIVTLVCDDGLRHISKFYNPKFWQQHGKELINLEDRILDILNFEV